MNNHFHVGRRTCLLVFAQCKSDLRVNKEMLSGLTGRMVTAFSSNRIPERTFSSAELRQGVTTFRRPGGMQSDIIPLNSVFLLLTKDARKQM